MAKRKFRHEDITQAPEGWRVRTIREKGHEARVAFPPGRRRKGSGQLVSILHPLGENPACEFAAKIRENPNLWISRAVERPGRLRLALGKKEGQKITLAELNDVIRSPQKYDRRDPTGIERAAILAKRLRGYHRNPRKKLPREFQVARDKIAASLKKMPKPIRRVMANPWAVYDESFEEPRPLRFSFADKQAAEIFAKQQRADHPGTKYSVRKINPGQLLIFGNPRRANMGAGTRYYRLGGFGGRRVAIRLRKHPDGWTSSATVPASLLGGHKKVILSPLQSSEHNALYWAENELEHYSSSRRNPGEIEAGVTLYQAFHGKDPHKIRELQQSLEMRLDYVALGKLLTIYVLPEGEPKAAKLDFDSDGVTLASNVEGTQLYFIGGSQKLDGCARAFPGVDWSKDFVDLGDAVQVEYAARKKFDNFQPVTYYHKLGEDSGVHPRLAYDTLNERLMLIGGSYHVEAPGIVD